MISRELALRLHARLLAAGRAWEPADGDRFIVPERDLDTDIFVVSGFTIEVEQLPTGPIVKFNGTTEWALDSLGIEDVVWVPWEHQLRSLLGDAFARLEAHPAPSGGFVVQLTDGSRHADISPERAYARALLAVL